MTTFIKANFAAKNYRSYRPTYAKRILEPILTFHNGSRDVAVDLGCGPGQFTKILAQAFTHVIGTDPSQSMLDAVENSEANIKYMQSSAEDLSFLEDESVDIVTAAQAAHWFDHQKVES